jgi:TIGR04076 family protein
MILRRLKMHKVRITILKTTFDSELAREYGAAGLGPCPMMKSGQVFYADYAKPDGFCDEAWKAIYQYVFALSHGSGKDLFYFGDWIRKPGVAIVSCNDGLRPVIMKLEATDIPSKLDYEPVLHSHS